jgi:hypothetical protein
MDQVDATLKDSKGRTAPQFSSWKKNEAIAKVLELSTSL